ncbi:transposase [Arthrobacter sp. NPDC056727]|uniref:transposase n=1 Tax=Arthrobacter sp. NPDC056727 TaxID=3345927 RepID=UPI00367011C2
MLVITGATPGKVEANNTAIKNIKRTARGYRNPANAHRSAVSIVRVECRPVS